MQAAECFARLGDCQLKCDSKHEAATAYVEAAKMAAKAKPALGTELLQRAVGLYTDMGRLNMAARQLREIAEVNEKEGAKQEALAFYEQAADLFETDGANAEATKCRQVQAGRPRAGAGRQPAARGGRAGAGGAAARRPRTRARRCSLPTAGGPALHARAHTTARKRTRAPCTCRLKIAEFAAELGQFPRAVELFEAALRRAVENSLLKFSVRS